VRRTVNVIKQLLEECIEEDRNQWKGDAQTVLAAVRASHPTRRGVKGAIAAAFFESNGLPVAMQAGWLRASGEHRPDLFRLAIEKDGRIVRILIGVLQVEAGKPVRRTSPQREPSYVALLPKRPRVRIVKGTARVKTDSADPWQGKRGWSLADFDVLAVSLQPLTRRWSDFSYTLSGWLTPSRSNAVFVENLQPVSPDASGIWTNDLLTCLEWHWRGAAGSPLPADRAIYPFRLKT
jgi:hypothetical protein